MLIREEVKMPLTKTGNKVLSNMEEQYGEKKGKAVFYASINKNKPGSSSWHKKTYSKDAIEYAKKMR